MESNPDQESESICEQTKTRLPELICLLEDNLMPRLKNCTEVFVFDEIKKFTEELINISTKYQMKILDQYSEKLSNAIRRLDLDEIEKMVPEFAVIIDRIKLRDHGNSRFRTD